MQQISEVEFNKSNWKESLSFIFLTAFLFLMPFSTQRNNFMIAGFIFFNIINKDFYKSFAYIWGGNKALWLPVAYFFVVAVGMVTSNDFDRAYTIWQRTGALFIFPVFMPYLLTKLWSKRKYLFIAFVSGVSVAAIYLLAIAIHKSVAYTDGQWIITHQIYPSEGFSDWYAIAHGYSTFSYSNLSTFMHPGYFSVMVNIAFVIVYIWLTKTKQTWLVRALLIKLLLFFALFIFLLVSRAGIVAFLGVVGSLLFFEVFYYKRKHAKMLALAGLLAFVVLSVFVMNARLKPLYQQYQNFDKPFYNENYKERADDRFSIWFVTLNLLQDHWLTGVGSGNTKALLNTEFEKLNSDYFRKNEFNCHNQYLEATFQSGITNLLLLVAMLGILIILGIRNKHSYFVAAGVVFIWFFMFESALLRINGAYLFASVYAYLVVAHWQQKKQALAQKVQMNE